MGKFLLAEKLHMAQVFDKDGNAVPVTLLKAEPNVVLQIKTREKDGYEAIQVGVGARREKLIPKPQRGHFADLGRFRVLREFRGTPAFDRGALIDITQFSAGDRVKVSAISKSKGFQGVVKRHGFHGAPKTHGTKHAHREPGSIGGGGGRAGGRVVKGMRMAGRMGGVRVSFRNLEIVRVDPEQRILAVRGAVPGRRGTLVEIRG